MKLAGMFSLNQLISSHKLIPWSLDIRTVNKSLIYLLEVSNGLGPIYGEVENFGLHF